MIKRGVSRTRQEKAELGEGDNDQNPNEKFSHAKTRRQAGASNQSNDGKFALTVRRHRRPGRHRQPHRRPAQNALIDDSGFLVAEFAEVVDDKV